MIQDNSLQPNLAQDLVRIHKVLSRGISKGVTRGAEFVKDGFPGRDLQQGFATYIQSLGIVLAAHHLGEDEIAFPALRKVIPSAPYDRLGEDHKKIEAAMGLLKDFLPVLAGANPADGLEPMMAVLKRISAVWVKHYKAEEKFFSSSALAGVLSPEEQAQVSISLAKHAQEHAGPPFLVLPFVLYNLAGVDRAEMAKTFPKFVIEQLVSKEWMEHWGPMKPFLLD